MIYSIPTMFAASFKSPYLKRKELQEWYPARSRLSSELNIMGSISNRWKAIATTNAPMG